MAFLKNFTLRQDSDFYAKEVKGHKFNFRKPLSEESLRSLGIVVRVDEAKRSRVSTKPSNTKFARRVSQLGDSDPMSETEVAKVNALLADVRNDIRAGVSGVCSE